MDTTSFYKKQLEKYIFDQRFILVGAAKAWMTGGSELIAKNLMALGAQKVLMIVNESYLQNNIPDFPRDCYIGIRVPSSNERDYLKQMATYFAAIRDNTVTIQQYLNKYDPDRRAKVIGPAWLKGKELLGRRVLGHRPDQWTEFEFDKIGTDQFFDSVGVPRADSLVVETKYFDFQDCWKRYDQGKGIVLVGEGNFTGGSGLLFIKSSHSVTAVYEWLRNKSISKIKVVSNLPGPAFCSHGFVLNDSCPTTPPYESISLEKSVEGEIEWIGSSSALVVREDERNRIHRFTEQVGNQLRQTLNYRGSFCLDGVLTPDGPKFTEINTRLGASGHMASMIWDPAPGFLQLLDIFIREFPEEEFKPAKLQEWINKIFSMKKFSLVRHFSRTKNLEKQVYSFRHNHRGLQLIPPEKNCSNISIEPGDQGSFVVYCFCGRELPEKNSQALHIYKTISEVCQNLGIDFCEYGKKPANWD